MRDDERVGDCADCPIYGPLTQCQCGAWVCEECRPWHDEHHTASQPGGEGGDDERD